ncbi:hypothetical protein [Pedobacter lusitanus]
MRKAIRIDGDSSEVLSVGLIDILNCIDDGESTNWGLLWLEAIGELDGTESILDLEQRVNKAEKVTIMAWKELLDLSSQITQAIDLLIIGDKDLLNIRERLTNGAYENCDYTIELIDSTYWIVYSKNDAFLKGVFEMLEGTKYLHR